MDNSLTIFDIVKIGLGINKNPEMWTFVTEKNVTNVLFLIRTLVKSREKANTSYYKNDC